MNCFQFVRSVLDELYDQIYSTYGDRTDQTIRAELLSLSNKFSRLESGNNIDYSNPVTRFAYIYCYTTAHADIVYHILNGSEEMARLFDARTVEVSCIGGGPGSDFLGILKFMTLNSSEKMKRLRCLLCDKEQAWRESWSDVDRKLSIPFSMSTIFWELDVTETSKLPRQTKVFQADLFTMIYFISELYYGREDARDFFELMVQRAKPGALFLFVDNNCTCFYEWFDEIALDAGLKIIEKREDYRFVVGWDEQADDLALYNNKFKRNPKLKANIAYRIYRKPEE